MVCEPVSATLESKHQELPMLTKALQRPYVQKAVATVLPKYQGVVGIWLHVSEYGDMKVPWIYPSADGVHHYSRILSPLIWLKV